MSTFFGRDISELHCIHCTCPKEVWKPMEHYQSDRCCEFYDDVYIIADNIEERVGFVTCCTLLTECKRTNVSLSFPDIPDFEAAVQECFDIFQDIGVFETKGGKINVVR